MKHKEVGEYMAKIGKRGKGKAKQRGDSEYYRQLALRSAKVRRKKANATDTAP